MFTVLVKGQAQLALHVHLHPEALVVKAMFVKIKRIQFNRL